uniref:Putative secreted protein n=1 Tax=Anopheles triannulatus TaxID=58253 RepID=A0A2M4B2G9_9DIPT
MMVRRPCASGSGRHMLLLLLLLDSGGGRGGRAARAGAGASGVAGAIVRTEPIRHRIECTTVLTDRSAPVTPIELQEIGDEHAGPVRLLAILLTHHAAPATRRRRSAGAGAGAGNRQTLPNR